MATDSKAQDFCRSCVNWTPVLFLGVLVVFSYYAYVVQLCIFTVSNIPQKVIYLVFYHILLLLMMWSFCAVLHAQLSPVPPQFFLTHSELEEYEEEKTEVGKIRLILEKSKSLPVHCRTANGDIRFCELCKCIKPDRAHHCSTCRRVNDCICFDNYKFFVLLVAYSCLYSFFVMATSLQYFIAFWTSLSHLHVSYGDVINVCLFIIAVLMCISLMMLLIYHCNLVYLNRTTMEHSVNIPVFVNGPDRFGFHHGTCANFVDVFGEQKIYWFLPVHSGGGSDGVTYARNLLSSSMSKYQSVESSQLSLSSTPSIKTSMQLVQPVSKYLLYCLLLFLTCYWYWK